MRSSDSARPGGLQRRLMLVLAAGALVLAVALVAGFNVVLRSALRSDADDVLRARASAALSSVVVDNGRIRPREVPGDSAIDRQVWVFAGGRPVEAPAEPRAADAAARAAAKVPGTFHDVPKIDLRLYGRPIVDRGRRVGAVVAGLSLEPYERSAREALVLSIALGALVLAAILAAARLAIRTSLRPVDRMTAEAAAWSVNDLDHRFADTGPRDELSRLGATFNDLLARLAASFRHEQRFSAELSHELRLPLAKIAAEAELAVRRERSPAEYRAALEAIARRAREMERILETLVAVARQQADPRSGTSDAEVVAASVVESMNSDGGPGIDLELRAPAQPMRLGVDEDFAGRVLAPIVDNALRYAANSARVDLRRDGAGHVDFVVTDDGPGVPADEHEAIFTPGFRSAARNGRDAGAGLGLALARRLATAAGGEVRCEPASQGAVFVVSLPSA